MAIRIDGTNTTANPGITGADADTGLQFGTNELKLVTGGTEAVKIDSNQKLTASQGILFGTDTADANTLDDYEEGTFTPVFSGATTSGVYTYATQLGRYTKIGNQVICHCSLTDITTVGAGSGAIRIKGFPYVSANESVFPHGVCRLTNFDVASGAYDVNATMNANSTQVSITISRDAQAATSVQSTGKLNNSADILLSLTYHVA